MFQRVGAARWFGGNGVSCYSARRRKEPQIGEKREQSEGLVLKNRRSMTAMAKRLRDCRAGTAHGATHRVDLDGVVFQIGLVANTEWLKGAVRLSPRGEIEIDARGETSATGIFAAGDATILP